MSKITLGSACLRYAVTQSMVRGKDDNEPNPIIQAIDDGPSLPVELTNPLICFLEEKVKRVGIVSSIFVDNEDRGQGLGKQLMQQYTDTVGKTTQIDLLVASVHVPQKEGFSLIKFYEQFGFKPVIEADGELLMVTKGHEQALLEYFGPQDSSGLRF